MLIGLWVLRKGFTGSFANLVDGGPGDSVLASHRAFPADLAGHVPPQFLGQAGAVQRIAVGLSARRTPSLLQLDRVHPHGDRACTTTCFRRRARTREDGLHLRMGPQQALPDPKGAEDGDRKIGFASHGGTTSSAESYCCCAFCAATLLLTACSRPATRRAIGHDRARNLSRAGPGWAGCGDPPAGRSCGESSHRSAYCAGGRHVSRGHVSRLRGSQGNRARPLPGSS